MEKAVSKAKPSKGKGERFLGCPHYESCLDYVAIPNWRNFNCESCQLYILLFKKMTADPEKRENTRVCEECGKNPTITPSSPLCASCIGKRAWTGEKRKKTLARRKVREGIQGETKPENPQQDPGTALTIEFGKHVSMLEEVKKLAEQELRPVDFQVIYMLKKYLDSEKSNKRT